MRGNVGASSESDFITELIKRKLRQEASKIKNTDIAKLVYTDIEDQKTVRSWRDSGNARSPSFADIPVDETDYEEYEITEYDPGFEELFDGLDDDEIISILDKVIDEKVPCDEH